MTIGADRPPYGTRHRKFSPLSAHLSMSPVSREMPSRFGPRISGQSPIAMRRGPCAPSVTQRRTAVAASHESGFTIGLPQIGVSKIPLILRLDDHPYLRTI